MPCLRIVYESWDVLGQVVLMHNVQMFAIKFSLWHFKFLHGIIMIMNDGRKKKPTKPQKFCNHTIKSCFEFEEHALIVSTHETHYLITCVDLKIYFAIVYYCNVMIVF